MTGPEKPLDKRKGLQAGAEGRTIESTVEKIGNPDLPIWQVMPEVIEKLRANKKLILSSPTGSGKTTQVPQALVQAGFHNDGTILVVENRVVVTVEIGKRVAEEMHETIGQRIGYLTGPEKRSNPRADVVFMTAGIFKNIIKNNPLLEGISVVIFDEFDERQILMDLGAALADKAQERGSKAKMMFMSATLNAEKLAGHFGEAPSVEAQGRLHEVTKHFATEWPGDGWATAAAKKIQEIHTSGKQGDILVFMPGKEEINGTVASLAYPEGRMAGATVLPLHSELEPHERHRVFEPMEGRKIIVSTDIAERGVTIDGIKFVIDSGLARKISYHAKDDKLSLLTEPCARDSLIQRMGRAGRTAPGEYHALYPQEDFDKRPATTRPEIAETPLRETILQLKSMGFSREGEPLRILDYDLIKKQNWKTGKDQLRALGCLNPENELLLSSLGERVAEFGIDPRDGVMIVRAAELGCSQEAAIIGAIRAGRPLLKRGRAVTKEIGEAYRKFYPSRNSDLINMLSVYRQAEATGFDEAWLKENYVSRQGMTDVRQNLRRIMEGMQRAKVDLKSGADEEAICRAIAAGFADRVFEYAPWHPGMKIGPPIPLYLHESWKNEGVEDYPAARLGRECVVGDKKLIATRIFNGFIVEATRLMDSEAQQESPQKIRQ